MRYFPFILIICSFFLQCTSSDESEIIRRSYSASTASIIAEVDYMEGQEPDTESVDINVDFPVNRPWEFIKNNVNALFGFTKSVEVPLELSSMEEIPGQNRNYTVGDILALAETHRDTDQFTETSVSFYILYLDGFLIREDEILRNVLGISIGGTTVIAIFKPVITRSAANENLRSFIEQSLIIHEWAHSLGLVNNGVAMVEDHHDSENGAHCTNQQCVMYFQNEGIEDLRDFIVNSDAGLNTVIFGQECLNDTQARTEGSFDGDTGENI